MRARCQQCAGAYFGETTGRRTAGRNPPWSASCCGAGQVGGLLFVGYYALLAPCIPWPATIALSVAHAIGIGLYAHLLARDPGDLPSLARLRAPGAHLRWCPYCECYVTKHPRTKHCHDCHKCVDGFDHHCGYLQACVGARNYRHFVCLVLVLFSWTAALLGLDVAVLTIGGHPPPDRTAFQLDSCNSADSTPRFALLAVHASLAAICLLATSALLLLHAYLRLTRQTTYEFIVGRRDRVRTTTATAASTGGAAPHPLPQPPRRALSVTVPALLRRFYLQRRTASRVTLQKTGSTVSNGTAADGPSSAAASADDGVAPAPQTEGGGGAGTQCRLTLEL